jgi:hypothetical protein
MIQPGSARGYAEKAAVNITCGAPPGNGALSVWYDQRVDGLGPSDRTDAGGAMDIPANEIEAIFNSAASRPNPVERAAYLEQACGSNAALRARVDALLTAREHLGSFLGQSNNLDDSDAAPFFSGSESQHFATDPTMQAQFRLDQGLGEVIGRYKLLQLIGEGGFPPFTRSFHSKAICRCQPRIIPMPRFLSFAITSGRLCVSAYSRRRA